MRPHRLRVTAFGAFAGTEEVRFDDLEGLFLLHGETGAGKTTLLDAIAFALYGKVPGVRGKVKRLRSDHAALGVRTEVQLEATVGGRRLRITRKPEQERPKKSGTGLAKEHASVILEEVRDGEWEVKSTRVGEADAEILDLMGMSADQFFQVVLLPQGEFAQFLHAGADARAELLQKLFGTDRFRMVEQWLAERRRTTASELSAADEHVNQLLARVSQAAAVPIPDDPEAAEMGSEWQLIWLADLVSAAEVRLGETAALVVGRKTALDAALAAKSEAEQLADRQRRRQEALRRQGELEAAAPAIASLRDEVDAAVRAAEVAPVLEAADRAAKAAGDARRDEERARDAIPPDREDLRAVGGAELRAAGEEQQERLGRLDGLRAVARRATDEETAADAARNRAARISADLDGIKAAAAEQRAARPGAADARDAASRAAEDLPAAQADAEARRRAADELTAMAKARARRDRVAEKHRLAAAEALDLDKEYRRIHDARIDGMRAELAQNLVAGTPCPVCGSLDHPELCELPTGWVSPEEEEQAYAAAGTAGEKADKAGQEVAAADATIADLTQRLVDAGWTVPEDPTELTAAEGAAAADATRLETSAAELKATAAALSGVQQALDDLDKAIADAERKQAELGEQRTAALAEAEGAASRAAEARETLAEQLGGAPDLEAALTATRRLADALADAADAAEETVRTAAEGREAWDRASAAAREAGFSEPGEVTADTDDLDTDAADTASPEAAAVAAARDAFREARWRTETARRIQQHETDVKSAASQLADPDLDVPLDPPAPVTEGADAAGQAQRVHEEAVTEHGRAKDMANQLQLLRPQLTDGLGALEPLRERAEQARQLADLAGGLGGNQYKMTLSSFVLAARLEEVAAQASERLAIMTAGRYTLVHTDARRGGGRAGLGLLACDAWTGQDRDTSTLSGGETFLASLALALGLADVVTHESAGTPMEALFVDEGFGTLDEETLEEVMNVLDGLRAGGRIVGIVSHVSELRQRIPAQVHVRKGHHGSHVEVTAGP
ncbi:MAG TPA: AAA family ATPase [Trebonia sp.]